MIPYNMQYYTNTLSLHHQLICLLFSPVKEKEDAHTDPEFQPMKDDDCTFGEYRWEKVLRPLEAPPPHPTPEPIFTHKPLPCPQLTAQICSLWLSWSSALPPSFQPLQLINNWPRITNNRNRKRKCPSSELLPPWSTRFFVLGSGTSWMLLVLDSLMRVCLRWHCGIIWEAGFFRFKGVWKLTSNFK